jgi:hypothetical protein
MRCTSRRATGGNEMAEITSESLKAAVQQHNSVFFDADLRPVQPQAGQWFCEVYIEPGRVQYDALVEYVGQSEVWLGTDNAEMRHDVSEDGAEDTRSPLGDALILQH